MEFEQHRRRDDQFERVGDERRQWHDDDHGNEWDGGRLEFSYGVDTKRVYGNAGISARNGEQSERGVNDGLVRHA